MIDISGQKCLESYEKYRPIGSWERTFAGLLVGMEGWFSNKCSLTWKLKDTKYSRLYFQLAASTPRIEEKGFGLSLIKTPTVMDGEVSSGKKNPVSGNSGTLAQEIMSGYEPTMKNLGLLPTPTSVQRDHPERVRALLKVGATTMMSRKNGEERPNSILDAVMFYSLLPTPTANCHKGGAVRSDPTRQSDTLAHHFATIPGKTSQLNPRFVMEMMGFPPDWTELPFLNGETSQSKQEETQ